MNTSHAIARNQWSAAPQTMVVDPDYLCFVGAMGPVPVRMMGAVTILVSIDQTFAFREAGGGWEQRMAAVVKPFTRHEFIAEHPMMGALMIEPEVVDDRRIEVLAERSDLIEDLRGRLKHLHLQSSRHQALPRMDFQLRACADPFVEALGKRSLDPRVCDTIERIRAQPWDQFSAQECADKVGLSFSRFLHLFRSETGTTFRRFVAWKRARHVLENLRCPTSLTDIALSVGYPDSTHFSHCVREVYGLQPREMFARCSEISLTVRPHQLNG